MLKQLSFMWDPLSCLSFPLEAGLQLASEARLSTMSSTLTPHNAADCNSPGSSIFDLPTTADSRLHIQSAAHIAGENTDGSFAGGASESGDDLEADDVPSCLVISGGTGCNAICAAFGTARASYVLPVSDDGGSSSEIIRVMGGPSIGAYRSAVLRGTLTGVGRRRHPLAAHSPDSGLAACVAARPHTESARVQAARELLGQGGAG